MKTWMIFPIHPITWLKSHFLAAFKWVEAQLSQEKAYWIHWVPIAVGSGIALYFSLSQEPTLGAGAWILGIVSVGVGLGYVSRTAVGQFAALMALGSSIGFGIAWWRVTQINPRPLTAEVGPLWIKGTVKSLDHGATSRWLYQKVTLTDLQPAFLPKAVTVRIHTESPPLHEGDRIRLRVKLSPLPPPYAPGSYDPQRTGYLRGLGGTGYALSAVQLLETHPSFFSRLRHTLTRTLHLHLPPPLGAVACALVTGDKEALPLGVRQDFSQSGLSHVLAISGLHLSIVASVCFFIFLRMLAWIPYLALYVNLQKVAALLALGVGWFYLNLSGQGYPAQRSFFMMAAALMAMVLSRRPYTLRIVTVCATGMLLWEPGALLSLSFQLSFAAVIGLVALYDGPFAQTKVGGALGAMALSTAVVTLITAPLLTFYFQQLSLQSLFANLIAIPLTSFYIIPVGIVALLSLATPFYSEAFWLWQWGLKGLIELAHLCAHYLDFLCFHWFPYAPFYFALQVYSGIWVLLWKGKWRWLGLGPFVVGMALSWLQGQKPLLLWDSGKGLLGYCDYTHRTLWVSSRRKGRFTAQRWASMFGLPTIKGMTLPLQIPPLTIAPGPILLQSTDTLDLSRLTQSYAFYRTPEGGIRKVSSRARLWNIFLPEGVKSRMLHNKKMGKKAL